MAILNFQCTSIEFFTKSVWETIPESWKEPLLALSDEEAATFPQGFIAIRISINNTHAGKVIKQDWPQSLTDFLKDIKKLAMPRHEVSEVSLPVLHNTPIHT